MIFGSETFVRLAGQPVTEVRVFSTDDVASPFRLHVVNGRPDGTGRVTSASIRVDGVEVLGPSGFGKSVSGHDIEVALGNPAKLEVRITGAPGTELTIYVDGAAPELVTLPRPHDTRTFTLDETLLPFDALAGASAYYGTYEGVQGVSGYRVEVPDQWNGVLVMYTHGHRGANPQLSVGLPNAGLRAHWVANGYAWAASSYSANYYDVRAGVEDTNELALRFQEFTGQLAPEKYYVVGVSMGGHIAGAAVEAEVRATAAHKVNYAGAVPMCGVMGDVQIYNYLIGYNVAAYHLAGMPIQSFPITGHQANLPAIKAALWVDYSSDKGLMTPEGEKLKSLLMSISGGQRPGFAEGFPNYQDRLLVYGDRLGDLRGVLGGLVVNTSGIFYQLDDDPAHSSEEIAFNSELFRILGDFLAHNPLRPDGVRAVPLIEGRFDVPVVTIHTLGDLLVPFSMQQIYAQRAASHGNSDRLVQRAIRATGHCGFSSDEQIDAFEAMADWVDFGTVPPGDNVLDPTVVAHPSYGCAFTSFQRGNLPAC